MPNVHIFRNAIHVNGLGEWMISTLHANCITTQQMCTFFGGDAAHPLGLAITMTTQRRRNGKATGKTNGAIAESLFLTKRAVEKHVNSIFSKLSLPEGEDVSRRVMATLIFLYEADLDRQA